MTTYTKEQIFEAIHYFINLFGVEPRAGFVANELSCNIFPMLEISLEGRSKGQGVAIARYDGEVVAHEFSGAFEGGQWAEMLLAQYEIAKRLDAQAEGVAI